MLTVFVNMGLLSTAFSVYFPYIRELRGFTNTEVYLLTTTRFVVALLAMRVSDVFYRRFDIRRGVAITFAVAAVGFAILTAASSPAVSCVGTALFGISYGIGAMIPASILIRRWFPEQSGTAIGIASTGSGIANMLMPQFATFMVERYGLSLAFAVQGAMVVVLGALVTLLVRNYPDDAPAGSAAAAAPARTGADDAPAGSAAAAAPARTGTDGAPAGTDMAAAPAPAEQVRPGAMVILAMLMCGVVALTASSGLSMLFRTTGHEMEVVSRVMSFFGFVLIVGKILLGESADRLGGRRSILLFSGILILSFVLLSMCEGKSFLYLCAASACYAVGASLATVGISITAADFSTEKTYPKALKDCQFFYALGGLLSSTSPGMIADLTGSYVPAYRVYFFLAVVMLAAFVLAYRGREARLKDAAPAGSGNP